VIPAWDFVYKTVAFTWVKSTKDGKGFPMGMGYHTRSIPKLCLLAARRQPYTPRPIQEIRPRDTAVG
jgi:N6-adenosine-specific RNA methylase IME4